MPLLKPSPPDASAKPRFVLLLAVLWIALNQAPANPISSPDGQIVVTVTAPGGRLSYSVTHGGLTVIEPSPLGITLNGTNFETGITISTATAYATEIKPEFPL